MLSTSHSGSVILRVVYGYEVQPGNDFYVGLADEAMRGLVQAVNVGSFMVDFLPVLKHIPCMPMISLPLMNSTLK